MNKPTQTPRVTDAGTPPVRAPEKAPAGATHPEKHAGWMAEAIAQARKGIASGQSPFGAVIVKNEEIIGRAHNEVWLRTDPSAHAEIVAIQRAAGAIRNIDLTGCEMYTTCEPCPMCASAAHWARVSRVYYGATIEDAAKAGFNELTLPASEVYRIGRSGVVLVGEVGRRECAGLFGEFLAARGRVY